MIKLRAIISTSSQTGIKLMVGAVKTIYNRTMKS